MDRMTVSQGGVVEVNGRRHVWLRMWDYDGNLITNQYCVEGEEADRIATVWLDGKPIYTESYAKSLFEAQMRTAKKNRSCIEVIDKRGRTIWGGAR